MPKSTTRPLLEPTLPLLGDSNSADTFADSCRTGISSQLQMLEKRNRGSKLNHLRPNFGPFWRKWRDFTIVAWDCSHVPSHAALLTFLITVSQLQITTSDWLLPE